jgi:hypothetical protein
MGGADNLFELLNKNSLQEIETILTRNPSASAAVNENNITLLLMAIYHRKKKPF